MVWRGEIAGPDPPAAAKAAGRAELSRVVTATTRPGECSHRREEQQEQRRSEDPRMAGHRARGPGLVREQRWVTLWGLVFSLRVTASSWRSEEEDDLSSFGFGMYVVLQGQLLGEPGKATGREDDIR